MSVLCVGGERGWLFEFFLAERGRLLPRFVVLIWVGSCAVWVCVGGPGFFLGRRGGLGGFSVLVCGGVLFGSPSPWAAEGCGLKPGTYVL